MGGALVCDGVENRLGGNVAAADHGAAIGRHQPRVAPAVAMEQRDDSQVLGIKLQPPADRLTHRVQIGPAVMIDHALGPPRGARGIVQRKAFPFVLGHDPFEIGIAGFQQCLVFHVMPMCMHTGLIIGDLDHDGGRAFHLFDGLSNNRQELRVYQNHLCLTVVQNIGDGFCLDAGVQRIQHRAACRHAEMRLGLGRQVGDDGCDHITRLHAQLDQSRRQTRDPLVVFHIGLAMVAIHHGQKVGIHLFGAVQP